MDTASPKLKQLVSISSRHLPPCLFYCGESEPRGFNKAIISVWKEGPLLFLFLPAQRCIKDPPDVRKLLALFISLINDSFVEAYICRSPGHEKN